MQSFWSGCAASTLHFLPPHTPIVICHDPRSASPCPSLRTPNQESHSWSLCNLAAILTCKAQDSHFFREPCSFACSQSWLTGTSVQRTPVWVLFWAKNAKQRIIAVQIQHQGEAIPCEWHMRGLKNGGAALGASEAAVGIGQSALAGPCSPQCTSQQPPWPPELR